jgi:hypothetical protein
MQFFKMRDKLMEKVLKICNVQKKLGKRPILKKTPFHASLIGNGINRVQPTSTLPNPMVSYSHPA